MVVKICSHIINCGYVPTNRSSSHTQELRPVADGKYYLIHKYLVVGAIYRTLSTVNYAYLPQQRIVEEDGRVCHTYIHTYTFTSAKVEFYHYPRARPVARDNRNHLHLPFPRLVLINDHYHTAGGAADASGERTCVRKSYLILMR